MLRIRREERKDGKDMMHPNSITLFTTVLLKTCSSSKNVLSKVKCREMKLRSNKVGVVFLRLLLPIAHDVLSDNDSQRSKRDC